MGHVPRQLYPRRIGIFILVSFGFSWLVAGYIFRHGGISGSSGAVDPSSLTILLVAYMFGPALGHLAVRLLTAADFSLEAAWLRPHFRNQLKWYVTAWFFPALLVLPGVALFYALFPQHFDIAMEGIRGTLGPEASSALSPTSIAIVQLLVALSLGPAINTLAAFGEEWGWRGFLLQHLLPYGQRIAVVGTGLVWGIWHWPIIAMGYNYGFDYAGSPWLGMLAMAWIAIFLGAILSWVTLQSGSVWPAAVGHGAFNAIAGYGILFATGEPNLLFGPLGTGLVVSLPIVLVGGLLLVRKKIAPAESAARSESGLEYPDPE